jgi:hypothetical protein
MLVNSITVWFNASPLETETHAVETQRGGDVEYLLVVRP